MKTIALTATLGALLLTGCAHQIQIAKTGDEWNNPRRLLTLRPGDVPYARVAVPREENFQVVGESESPEGVLVITYAAQVDWIRDMGIEPLAVANRVPGVYLDTTFAERAANPAPDDENGGLIVDQGYKDSAMGRALITAFAERYPEITSLHTIGETWRGKPLLVLKISDNPNVEEDEPAIFFNGAHHGSELLSQEPVWDTIEYLCENYTTDPRVRHWVDHHEIFCIPQVNPDGIDTFFHVAAGAGRRNGRELNNDGVLSVGDGVDLNRNYPFRWAAGPERASSGNIGHSYYRGEEPASEPEVQAVMALANAQRFVFSSTYHTAATRILIPYTIDDVQNPEPSAAWALAREIEPLVDSNREDRPYQIARKLYSVDGTDQDWHYFTHGTIAYLPELPRHNPVYEVERDPIVHGIRPLWMTMLDRLERGPSISGHVYDIETGDPLEAVVVLESETWFEDEVHTSHPESGRFDRILAEPGVHRLTIEHEGYHPAHIEVEVGDRDWVKINAALHPLHPAH